MRVPLGSCPSNAVLTSKDGSVEDRESRARPGPAAALQVSAATGWTRTAPPASLCPPGPTFSPRMPPGWICQHAATGWWPLPVQSTQGGSSPGRLRKMPPLPWDLLPTRALEIRGSWVQWGLLHSPPSTKCVFTDFTSSPDRVQSRRKCRGGRNQDLSFPAQSPMFFALSSIVSAQLPTIPSRPSQPGFLQIHTCPSLLSPLTPQLAVPTHPRVCSHPGHQQPPRYQIQ